TPRFKVSSSLMTYARLASGYRPGGTNNTVPGVTVAPPNFKPDTTRNYEIGVKGDVLHNTLSYDASLYYIGWNDIQLQVFDLNSGGYVANGGRAKSEGVELSVDLRPATGLTLAAWVTWNDAVLTEAFPPASAIFGAAGDRLPFGSRFSGNF